MKFQDALYFALSESIPKNHHLVITMGKEKKKRKFYYDENGKLLTPYPLILLYYRDEEKMKEFLQPKLQWTHEETHYVFNY